jgi:DNA-binding MarR family transcriptional regulator
MSGADHVDHLIEQWGRVLPELDVSPMAVIARISRLCRILERDVDQIYAEHGLNHAQFGVLAALRRSGPPYRLSPTELYNSLLITSGAVTNRLDRLTTAGLVRRVPDPGDGRSLLVALTPKGLRLIDRLLELHYAREAELLESLGARDREQLVRLLRGFLIGVERVDGDGSAGTADGKPATAATGRSSRRRREGSGPSRRKTQARRGT